MKHVEEWSVCLLLWAIKKDLHRCWFDPMPGLRLWEALKSLPYERE